MFKSLILTGLLSSGIGAFATTPLDNQPLYTPQEQAVIYIDDDYTIKFTPSELNNYTFDNTANWFSNLTQTEITDYHIADTTLYYMGIINSNTDFDDSLEFDEIYVGEYFSYSVSIDEDNFLSISLDWSDESQSIWLINTTYGGDFDFAPDSDDSFQFDWGLNNSTLYELVKAQVELDIQANTHSNSHSGLIAALMSFVTLLTSGIVQLATGIAGGIAHMAKALFLNAAGTHLSIFGGLIAIFAGLALAVALTTKVYTWITSLGN